MTYPTKDVYVTCEFGRPGSWMAGKHTGIDYRAAVGTPIYATRGGVVEHTGWGGYGEAYGHHVIIRSPTKYGRIRKVLYAHLSGDSVSVGERVEMGERIATSGDTGNTFGPHLHYEERVSPFTYWNYARPVFPYYRKRKPRVAVRLSRLKPGKRNLDVARVRRRLRRKGIKVKRGFRFNRETREAYAKWQKKLGYSGTNANGIPGPTSLRKLGFAVKP